MSDFTIQKFIIFSLFSFFIGFISALLITKFGQKLGLVDIPNIRSSHKHPTPRGGGIGIPIAAGIVTFILLKSLYIMVGFALILAIFTFIDDKKGLPIRIRFILQLLLALALVLTCRSDFISLINHRLGLGAVLVFIAFAAFFITAATNFFNFMDGINGISGLIAIISFGLLGVYTFFYKTGSDIPLLSIVIVFSAMGFLLLNFPRARVFMGDVGSIFTGNLFAAAVVLQSAGVKEFLLLTLFQATFYIDCISTLIIRLFNKENILEAHKKHLYQRFVHGLKWSHIRVTLLYSLVQVFTGLIALWLYQYNIFYLVLLWLILVSSYWFARLKMNLIN